MQLSEVCLGKAKSTDFPLGGKLTQADDKNVLISGQVCDSTIKKNLPAENSCIVPGIALPYFLQTGCAYAF
jgi:hypothetical protein